jgi:FtsP/CotA-like multicopper oxidase with cupredoxin domain
MKRLLTLIALLLMFSAFAAAQATQVPVCNGFNATGVPINTASGSTVCTDYFGVANWANSPLPAGTITGYTLISPGSGYVNPQVVISDITGAGATGFATADSTGAITGITGSGTNYTMPMVSIVDVGSGGTIGAPTCGGAAQPACGSGAMATAIIGPPFSGGMLKFQDALPDLKAAIAAADTTTFPGSDFYVIGLVEYKTQMHANLPQTTLRGYCQLINGTCSSQSYLGPVILAQKDRPVRVLFRNLLATGAGGNLFIPMDSTYMGADPNHQNRATLHLHGGATPWISDGTPHQWTVPEGDTPLNGVSTQPVPDMYFAGGSIVPYCSATVTSNCYPNASFTGGTFALPSGATTTPTAGDMTFYWTNQQGGRLMFYHDHAYGITRLNVYVGEAAGYLLYDPAEETALANAGMPGSLTAGDLPHLIPLVIQDKTFVPSPAQINMTDPTWAAFGKTPGTAITGDLWFPHVYMPNQNPNDPLGGASGLGHWDYGAWFFPPQTSLTAGPGGAVTIPCTSALFPGQVLAPAASNNNMGGCPIIPNPSGTPEGFMDTPIVNGKAYPVLHVAPEAYRFKILSAGNDRSWNLSWFIADPTQPTEVAMLPAVPPSTGSAVPLCGPINPIAVPMLDLGLATGMLDGTGNPLNGTGLPSGCWPNYGPQPGIPKPQAMWAADGRAGGAPDPRNAGPAWVQIGSEGGLLPAPVVIPPTAINYEQNTRSITIGSVAVHGLWLGPAERADVLVDFTRFAGKTLILYNDAPAPAPAIDSRLDFFTDDGDQTPIGGAPNTPAGYGPNTRTIMQVVVDAPSAGGKSLSLPLLKAVFASTATTTGIFAATQPTTIIPEPAYNSAYNSSFPPKYSGIGDNSISFTPITPQNFEALLAAEPSACGGTTIPPVQCASFNHKALQELFTLDYGRMNATLGTELPNVNFTNQTTIPLGYVDPATEIIRQGDSQVWKITHNGVDSHFIHFHLFNVQVINRVGWDGSLRPPDANEMGWKDTVRMNPLEDIIVALQPITPQLPWPIPNSVRLNDVTGMGNMFTNANPFTNLGANTIDGPTNFGWEYVWHCHILGHEENDMMRPIMFQVPPPAPTNLNAVESTSPSSAVTLTFTDNSASETGFTVERDETSANFAPTDVITKLAVGPSGPNLNAALEGTDFGGTITATDSNVGVNIVYYYRVQAVDDGFKGAMEQSYNTTSALLSAFSNIASVSTVPIAPTVTFTGAPPTAAYNTSFTVTATTNASSIPTITGTAGVCTVGAVSGTAANATALVTMTNGSGTCSLLASWAADQFFTAATATATTTARPAAQIMSFTGAPVSAADLSTFTVTATTNSNSIPTITGTTGVCTVGAVSGTAANATALVTMTSGTGTCTLTANWAADANYIAAGPATQSTLATKIAPTVTFTGAPGTAVYNTSFLVAASTNATTMPTIAGAAGICTVGTVTGTPANSTATVTMTSGTGTCTLTANWAADANYAAAGPRTQSTLAAKAASTTTIGAPTPNPSVVGQSVSVPFSVTGTGVGPTGTVTVTAKTGESCTGTVAAGSCSPPLTFVTTGKRTMTANYAGDANFLGSTSAASASQNVLDFVLGISPGAQNVKGGQKASYQLTATAIGGVVMPISPITCVINQPAFTCTVSPTSLSPNGGTKSATVTVNTIKGHPGTWTLTVTGVDTQTGFTLTRSVTANLTVSK